MPKNRIHKRKDGRYIYSATDQFGKSIQLTSRKHENLPLFRERCNKLDKELATLAGTQRLKFNELFKLWKENHLKTKSISHQEVMTGIYDSHIKKKISHFYLSEITPNVIYNLLQSKIDEKYSKSTISKMRAVMSAPFAYAIKSGLYKDNPVSKIRLSYGDQNKRKNPNIVISDENLEKFFKLAEKTKYYSYYRLLLITGLRPSECLGLKHTDLHQNAVKIERAITVTGLSAGKTQFATRKIPATDEVKTIFENQKNNTVWLFLTNDHTPRMEAIKSNFQRLQRRLDFQITLYSFRHTFATKMARAGMPPKTLQYILGHSNINITLEYYVGIEDEDLQLASDLISANF